MRGEEAMRIRSISDSCNLLVFARRFWNHIFTCVSVSFSEDENSALSEIERYCFWRNFFSSSISCFVEKGVRGFRFGLCFRRVHFKGPNGILGASEIHNVAYNMWWKYVRIIEPIIVQRRV